MEEEEKVSLSTVSFFFLLKGKSNIISTLVTLFSNLNKLQMLLPYLVGKVSKLYDRFG